MNAVIVLVGILLILVWLEGLLLLSIMASCIEIKKNAAAASGAATQERDFHDKSDRA